MKRILTSLALSALAVRSDSGGKLEPLGLPLSTLARKISKDQSKTAEWISRVGNNGRVGFAGNGQTGGKELGSQCVRGTSLSSH